MYDYKSESDNITNALTTKAPSIKAPSTNAPTTKAYDRKGLRFVELFFVWKGPI